MGPGGHWCVHPAVNALPRSADRRNYAETIDWPGINPSMMASAIFVAARLAIPMLSQ